MAVASRVWFLGLPFSVWYVFTLALVFADWLFFVEEPLFVAWDWLSKCNKVWCLFWHLWHTCFEQVWSLSNDCKQLKHSLHCLAWWRRCWGCNLRNLSHLNNLCEPLHSVHWVCITTFAYEGLLTLPPYVGVCLQLAVTVFIDWVFCSNSRALHLDSKNVIKSDVDGMFSREAVISSHSRCFSIQRR
jgi:hypothetical protein